MSTVIDGSAGITTNAGGSVNPSTNIDGINYSCRAWVNFNGTTSPITIRASGNVTNITDNGTGDYTVNFTTAMTDANYSVVGGGSRTVVNMLCITARSFATSSVNITPIDSANAKVDSDITTVAIIR